jgi:hypothetical protein
MEGNMDERRTLLILGWIMAIVVGSTFVLNAIAMAALTR